MLWLVTVKVSLVTEEQLVRKGTATASCEVSRSLI